MACSRPNIINLFIILSICLAPHRVLATSLTAGDICLSCDEISIVCGDGSPQLDLECVLTIPQEACDAAGLSSGDTITSNDIGGIQDELSDFNGESVSFGEGHDRCVGAHEMVHAKHASREHGGSLVAAASEVGAYDKEINCLENAKNHAASEQDKKLLERQQKNATKWRDYNLCLLGMHPDPFLESTSSSTSWDDICQACKELAEVDGSFADQYCMVNAPGSSIYLCGYSPQDPSKKSEDEGEPHVTELSDRTVESYQVDIYQHS